MTEEDMSDEEDEGSKAIDENIGGMNCANWILDSGASHHSPNSPRTLPR